MVRRFRSVASGLILSLLVVLAPLPAAAAATYSVKLSISATAKLSGRFLYVWDRATWTYRVVQGDADSTTGTVSLPPGDYFAVARYGYFRQRNYLLVKTFKVTNAGLTVTFDEKAAKETRIVPDDTTATRFTSAVWLTTPGGVAGFASGGPAKTYVTPFSVAGVSLRIHDILTTPKSYRYDLYHSFATTVPATPTVSVTRAKLAKTATTLGAQGPGTAGALGSAVKGGWSGSYVESKVLLPGTVTEYVTPGVALQRRLTYGSAESYLTLPDRTLTAGTHPGTTVGTGPFGPAPGTSARVGGELRMNEPISYADAAGNPGTDGRARETHTLTSDGDTHHFDQTVTRRVPWSHLSTKVRSEWTFTAPADGPVPLIDAGFTVTGLTSSNRTASTRITAHAATRGGGSATVTALEYSTDDGATWTDVPADAFGVTAAYVSLRVTATNDQGGRLRRTVIRAFGGPAAAGDESAGTTKLSNVAVNGGKALAFGTSGTATFTATFTATDPAGISGGDAYLYHGSYDTPDGVALADGPADCARTSDTTSRCTAHYTMNVKLDAPANALAGTWKLAAWADATDGTGYTDRHAAGSVAVKRTTKLTADATPEPVKKGKTITITGALTRADWGTWTFRAYTGRSVVLQYLKAGTSTWKTVKTVTTDSTGKLKTTVKASADGSFRWTYATDTTSAAATTAGDYVDVK
ncbi:hypothetical protein ACPCHT_16980 [Nucisporomicrobium flavum]|uniref:hypothetical protein n=1 Tax=Nucisporomicrobium flavum TaxID=2785915 RepID=UPI003C30BD3F